MRFCLAQLNCSINYSQFRFTRGNDKTAQQHTHSIFRRTTLMNDIEWKWVHDKIKWEKTKKVRCKGKLRDYGISWFWFKICDVALCDGHTVRHSVSKAAAATASPLQKRHFNFRQLKIKTTKINCVSNRIE